jgi:polyisoprenoid-binding protein YceI
MLRLSMVRSLLFASLVVGAAMSLVPGLALADNYAVDGAHSFVNFRIKHMGVSYAYGRFDDLSGTFMLDESSGAGMTFDMAIKAASVDTGNPKRDEHLKGPDFFNVKEFPSITFKSKQVRRNGEKGFEVGGDLELHGVVRAVNVRLERVGSGKDPWGGFRTGFEGSFVIKRSDFGMAFGQDGMLGDEVTIYVAFEGVKK